jgi:hypothetical protein
MKRCTYCGREYPDDIQICPIDQQPVREPAPAAPVFSPLPVTDKERIINEEHLRLLSIFHFVLAGLSVLAIGFLLLHFLIMSTVFSNPEMWKHSHSGPPPRQIMALFIWFYLFFGGMLTVFATLNFLSGLFLHQRKHRVFSLVVGGINCVQIPFGTVLGIFSIIVLSRSSIRQNFQS